MKKMSVLSAIAAGTLLLAPVYGFGAEKSKSEKSVKTKVPAKIIAYAERDNSVYKVGENIRFKIWLVQPETKKYMDEDLSKVQIIGDKTIDYVLEGDGGLLKKGSLVTSGKDPVIVECKLDRPGFVLLTLTSKEYKDEKGRNIIRYAGAGVEPLKIVSGTKMPEDFEAYWANEIKKLRSRKPVVTCREAVEYYNAENKNLVKIYDVRIDDGEVNATGILTIPRYSAREKLPAKITFGGASWIGSSPAVTEAVYRDVMVFAMNIHDTHNFIRNANEKTALRKRPDIANYQYNNIHDKEKYAPRKIFLRIVRSLDYLKSRPEWNKKDLIAAGPSFGGCQTIVAAALDKDITLACPGGPAMADHLGAENQQKAGWPKLLRSRFAKVDMEKAKKNSAYFDVANFARLIKCPVVFSVGFIDTVCPPTSVYAAYNNVPGENKMMINGTRAEHGSNRKPGEDGAFAAGSSVKVRELLMGSEMLSNRDMDYTVPGKKNAKGEIVPYIWDFRKGVAKAMKEGEVSYVHLTKGMTFFQNIFNLRKTECKLSVSFVARGKGRMSLMVSTAKAPVYHYFDLTEEWQTYTAEYTLKDGSYSGSFLFTVSGEYADIDKVSAQYNK
ncbi:MAG: acetylxylan esterase [Lentisphaeria bacterium]|nr:acetylxylan esterase [Lentisphaeria bacterium]